jgi:hypothetical protein
VKNKGMPLTITLANKKPILSSLLFFIILASSNAPRFFFQQLGVG